MSIDATASQTPDHDIPPHLASLAAFARWCRENPEGLRQMEQTARRMELGEFGDLSPKLQVVITRFLGVRKLLQEVEAQRAGLLAEIAAMRTVFAQHPTSVSSAQLVAQLDAIEQRLRRGEDVREEWAEFRLQFAAFEGELLGSIKKSAAKIAMSLDAHNRRDPRKFAQDANAQALLREWRHEGMRERIFGDLPIADRRELEALERQWREKPPGEGG